MAAGQGLRVLAVIPDTPVPLAGDRLALRRVLDVLLDNAVKYSAAPGEITLSLEPNTEHVLLKVRDNGPGLPAEEHGKIFERFYRIDKARSRQMGGAGLGLAIARWIVYQHHGAISVQSVPGEGAEFSVTLPAARTVLN